MPPTVTRGCSWECRGCSSLLRAASLPGPASRPNRQVPVQQCRPNDKADKIPRSSVYQPPARSSNAHYGLGWWLVHDTLPDGAEPPPARAINGWPQSDDRFPGAMYIARGGGNQRMYIVPEWELVIVRQQRIGRTGPVRSEFSELEFWQELVGGER